ncbi:SARP family transcriptional regulator [Desertihabitans brevis]|uniref:SARP family transcriptional regulator n=1 Tax=Desertihabitans brevis TaxID=2268447 RepID=A0A367YU79_9ACTN|nr:BTAD domain-containing putative transcriptional regulator [Desertihabitans brevis]RCK69436.1 SARP family transcriptional regulator [Desertihabitans brevis]
MRPAEPPPSKELRLLGSFQVRFHGSLRPLPHSAERVVAIVALIGPLDRSHAGQLLWPDAEPGRARASLRAAVSRLASTAEGLLHVSGDVLALADDVVVDLDTALAWIDATIYGTPPPTVTSPPRTIGRAVLPGWLEDWVDRPRERLHTLQVQALEISAERLLASGRHAEALPYALAAADLQPWSESANRLVIEIHARRGDPSNALRRFRRFRRALEQELGVQPGQDMLAAVRQLYPFGNTLAEPPRPPS